MANDGAIDILINFNTIIDKQNAIKETKGLTNSVYNIMEHLAKELPKLFGNGSITKGAESQLDKLKNAIMEMPLAKQDQAWDLFNVVKNNLGDANAELKSAYGNLGAMAQEVIKNSSAYKDLDNQIRTIENDIESMYEKAFQNPLMAKGITFAENNSYAYNFIPKDTKLQIEEFYKEINRLQAALKNLYAEQDKMKNMENLHLGKVQREDLEETIQKYLKAEDATEKYKLALQALVQLINSMSSEKTDAWTKEYAEVEKVKNSITKLYNQITQLGRKKDVPDFMWKDMQAEITKTENRITELQQKLTGMIKDKSAFAAKDLVSADEQNAEIQKVESEIGELTARLNALKNHYTEVVNKSNELGNSAEKSGKKSTNAFLRLSQDVRRFAYTVRAYMYIFHLIGRVINFIERAVKKVFSVAKSALQAIGSFISKVASGITTVVKKAYNVVKKLLSSISAKIKDVTSHIKLFNFSFGGLVSSARAGFKKILSYLTRFGFGVRSIFALVRKMRTAFIDMFKAAAEQIPSVNEEISALMTLINQLKGSLVTIFQPLVSAILPAKREMKSLTEEVVKLANTIGSFMAALTGQGFIYEFVADEQDYAQSVKDAADNTNKATKATKEYQKALMGFDQINRLPGPENEDKDEDAYDPTANAKGKWVKKMVIDKDAKELAQKIKDLWEQVKKAWKEGADFTNIGKKVSELLSSGLDKLINFVETKLKEYGVKLTTALATFLNGLLTKDLANKIGEFAGKLVNTIQTIIRNFLGKMNWHQLGEFLAASLNKAIKTWDAKQFGKMIADFLIAAISTWWSFVEPEKGFNFEQLGQKIATAINNFFARMNEVDPYTNLNHWQELGQAISNTIIGITDTVTTAINGIKWDQVVNALITAIKNINWSGIIEAFSGLKDAIKTAIITSIKTAIGDKTPQEMEFAIITFFLNLITSFRNNMNKFIENLRKLINGISWFNVGWDFTGLLNALIQSIIQILNGPGQKFAKDIGLALNALIAGIDFSVLGSDFTNLTSSLIKTLTTFINTVDWVEVGNSLAEFFNSIDFEQLSTDLSALASSLVTALSTVLQQVDFWPIIKSIMNGLNNVKDSAIDAAPLGVKIVAGLVSGLKWALLGALPGIGALFVLVIKTVKGIFEIHSPSKIFEDIGINIIQGLLDGINSLISSVTEKFNTIKENVLSKATEMKTNLQNRWEEIKSSTSEKWSNIKETITTTVEDITTKVTDKVNAVKDKMSEIWENIKTTTKNIWDGISSVVKGGINGIIDFINKMISGVTGGINAVINALNSFHFTLPDWLDKVSEGLGGKSIGFNLSPVSTPQIPRLAKGAVIPPNKQFLAMLGDQSHGTNVEAPLTTIQEAVANVMDENLDAIAVMIEAVVAAINNKNLNVNIGDKEIGQAAARYTRKQNLVKGI